MDLLNAFLPVVGIPAGENGPVGIKFDTVQ